MDATSELLKTQSPIELTTASIAQKAETSAATFYVYFDDAKDVLCALGQAAVEEIVAIQALLDEPWDSSRVEIARARRLVETADAVWQKHRAVMRYVHLEADLGNDRFQALRDSHLKPLVSGLANHVLLAYPPGKRPHKEDAWAEAMTLFTVLFAFAGTDRDVLERQVGIKRLQQARARILARALGGRRTASGK